MQKQLGYLAQSTNVRQRAKERKITVKKLYLYGYNANLYHLDLHLQAARVFFANPKQEQCRFQSEPRTRVFLSWLWYDATFFTLLS